MTIFYRGKLGTNYVFWNNTENSPFGVTDIIVVNSPVLTASSVDGPINALNGLSGSLQTLSNGSPYLLAGNNINLVTNSLGQVEITGSMNGSSSQYWSSNVLNNIYTTGSIYISGSLSASNGLYLSGNANINGIIIPSGSASLSGSRISGDIIIADQIVASGNLKSLYSSGNEGGEITLALAQTNNALTGNITIDIYQNSLRIFESGGTNRGGYFDVTKLGAGVSTRLDGSVLDYSIVDVLYYGSSQNLTIDTTDTNYSFGNKFSITRSSRSIAGVRFAVAITSTYAYSASLWNNAGTLLASKVITCNSGSFIYEALFDTPVSITNNLINQDLTVGIYQLSAANYSYVGVGNFQNAFPSLPFLSNGFSWREFSLYSAGNAKPTTSAASERYPVEPIIVG